MQETISYKFIFSYPKSCGFVYSDIIGGRIEGCMVWGYLGWLLTGEVAGITCGKVVGGGLILKFQVKDKELSIVIFWLLLLKYAPTP